jgi:hypothetical protein
MNTSKETMLTESEVAQVFHGLWDQGRAPAEWAGNTEPNEKLIWRPGHPHQVNDLFAIGHLLDLEVRVIGQHWSKSVGLPVGMFRALVWGEETVYFITRDNFHDLKLVVSSSCPIHIPYDVVHRHTTADKLAAEKQRSYDYCKTHSDFDPAKYETDAWFDNWSHDTLLRMGGEIYRCGTTHPVYYEGMDGAGVPRSVFQRYEHGRRDFAVQVYGATLDMMQIMRAVCGSVQNTIRERRDLNRAVERHAELSALPTLTPYQEKDLREAVERMRAADIDPDAGREPGRA